MDAKTTALLVIGAVVALYMWRQYQETERQKATAAGWNSLIGLGGKLAGAFL